MKIVSVILLCITFLAINVYAGNFFKDLEKLAKVDKMKKKIQVLETENAKLKADLKKHSTTQNLDFNVINIADANSGAKLTISSNHLINGSDKILEYTLTFPNVQLLYSISVLDHLSRPVRCSYSFKDALTGITVDGVTAYQQNNQPVRLQKIPGTDKIIFKLQSNIALSKIQVMGITFN